LPIFSVFFLRDLPVTAQDEPWRREQGFSSWALARQRANRSEPLLLESLPAFMPSSLGLSEWYCPTAPQIQGDILSKNFKSTPDFHQPTPALSHGRASQKHARRAVLFSAFLLSWVPDSTAE
jgi:hypothetical protein